MCLCVCVCVCVSVCQRKILFSHNNLSTDKLTDIFFVIQGVKNNVYNVSGMIEEVKTNTFFI